MKALKRLSDLELVAHLCSRVCHDAISPVGAIVNGLELADEDSDESMRESAMMLVRKSAANASAKLQFARLAFGASGSAGAEIDLMNTRAVIQDFLSGGKVSLEWSLHAATMAKDEVKLLLNLFLVALQAIPRGGVISVDTKVGEHGIPLLFLCARGDRVRIPDDAISFLSGKGDVQVSSHNVHAYYAALLAEHCGFRVDFDVEEDQATILLSPAVS